jgi:hypothetical protein
VSEAFEKWAKMFEELGKRFAVAIFTYRDEQLAPLV